MVEAKGGAGSATLSMAYAGFRYVSSLHYPWMKAQDLNSIHRFTESVLKAAKGQKGIVEPSYVYLPGIQGGDAIVKETGLEFFSVPIELGVCSHVLRRLIRR